MKSRKTEALPAQLARARERFDHWRKTRQRRRIPEKLWKAAVRLAADYGTYRTARTLRLNCESLKKRVQSVSQDARPSQEQRASFWELIPSADAGARASRTDPEFIVEVEDGSGRKLRVQWKGEFAELSALSQRLWSKS
jgi:hypothetical protein